jgi:hypothetical protein
VDEELCDLGAVRLVRRQRKDHLHRADQLPVGESRQDQPAALLDLGRPGFEDAARVLVRERRQKADRRAAGDAVGEDGRERV